MTFQRESAFKIAPTPAENPSKESAQQELDDLKAAWKKALQENWKYSNGVIKAFRLKGEANLKFFYQIQITQSGAPDLQRHEIIAVDENLQPVLITAIYRFSAQGVIQEVEASPIADPKKAGLDSGMVMRIVESVIRGKL